jgi:hypothetical protein
MRGLRIALGACLLFTAPALIAQAAVSRPNVRTIPPFRRVVPGPPARPVHPSRPIQPNRPIRSFGVGYPVYVDGYFGNQYVDAPVTPVAPVHREQPKPSKNGEDVFASHSTNDAFYAR